MKITFLGHASFKIIEDGKIVYVDPWLTGPTSPITIDDVDKADIVLVTHDHGDHGYAEALGICKKTGATFVAINELAHKAGWMDYSGLFWAFALPLWIILGSCPASWS